MFHPPKPLALLKKFGRERFTVDDFLKLVRDNDIELVLDSTARKGYYYYSKCNRHVIVLSTRISRDERKQVAWHEFAHFLQNYFDPKPMMASYCTPDRRNDQERLADGFAFVCVTGVPICGRMDFLETLMTGKGLEKSE